MIASESSFNPSSFGSFILSLYEYPLYAIAKMFTSKFLNKALK
jgi:hypothetical protein